MKIMDTTVLDVLLLTTHCTSHQTKKLQIFAGCSYAALIQYPFYSTNINSDAISVFKHCFWESLQSGTQTTLRRGEKAGV
jgi:hypothetical protein